MAELEQEPKTRKQIIFGRGARALAGFAGLLFILPERVFADRWANGVVIQFALIGVLVLIAVFCAHLSD
jgi:hypothetical protein